MSVELHVDWTRCNGHGLCHVLLPQRIDADEWGFPMLTDPHVGEDLPSARRAVAACPALALSLTGRNTSQPGRPLVR